eukprot:6997320-Prymnesium_polylepis.1
MCIRDRLSSDRVQSEQAVSTLRSQLAEAKGVLKEAEAKATEFAKEYGKEFYLRRQIAEQLQEMTGGLRVFCRAPAVPQPAKDRTLGHPTPHTWHTALRPGTRCGSEFGIL